METLCAQLPNRKLTKQKGTLLTFEPTQVDREILDCFRKTYGRKIADKRIYTSVREHGPRQLTYGIMTSEEDVDTVYIPIAMEAQLPPQVFYQGDRNIELQETQSWTTGVPIRTVGGSRLHVKKEGGPVCFLMVEFIKVQSEKQEGTEEKDKMEKD